MGRSSPPLRQARADILRTLSKRIQEIESTRRPRSESKVSLGIRALDDLLPKDQSAAGSLVELLSTADGAGTWTLALLMANHACGERKALVVTDLGRSFYPPAAAKLGIDWSRTIVVRPRTWRDAYAAIDQSLRCPAVGAVVSWCERLRTADYRRLQLAAEAGGGVGLLLRPAGALRAPSFAALRLRVTPAGATASGRRVRVEVARCHGGKDGGVVVVEIDDETDHVRLSTVVAPATPAPRTAPRSG